MTHEDGGFRARLDRYAHRRLGGPLRLWHAHLLAGLLLLALGFVSLGVALDRFGPSALDRFAPHGGLIPGGPRPPVVVVFSGAALPGHFRLQRFVTHLSADVQNLVNACVGFTIKEELQVISTERYAAAHHGSTHGGRWFSWGYIWRQSNGGGNNGITYDQAFSTLASQGNVYHSQAIRQVDDTNYFGGYSPGPVERRWASAHRVASWRLIRPGDQVTMKSEIVAGRPFGVGIPVFASLLFWHSCSYVTYQSGGFEFYHSMLAVGYTRDGVILANWWGTGWGCGGFLHLTWKALLQYNAYIVTAIPEKPVPRPRFGGTTIGPPPPIHRLSPAPRSWCSTHQRQCLPPPPMIGGAISLGLAQVHNVVTRDTHINISGLINYYGKLYGVPPAAVAAMIGTESGLHQYAPRFGDPATCDISFSLTQVTVCTAGIYGVGDGTASAANVSYVENYVNSSPAHSIQLGVRALRDFQNTIFQRCGISWPRVYIAYNAGPYRDCSFYLNPYGQAYSNYYSNFLPWWQTSLTTFAFVPAPPRPFPLALWCQYSVKHRIACASPRFHGSLSLVASKWRGHARRCQGVIGREQWNPRKRVMLTGFQGCSAFSWPTHPGWPVKFAYHRVFGGSPALSASERCAGQQTGCVALEVQWINAERSLYGITPLTINWRLGRCALTHSREMAAQGYIYHNPGLPDITSCWSGSATAGQNVGESSGTKAFATTLIHQLMVAEPYSPGCTGNHHCQMLDPRMTTIGIGFTRSNGLWFETQDYSG